MSTVAPVGAHPARGVGPGVRLGPLATDLHVALDLVGLQLGLAVAGVDEVGGGVTPTETEGERRAQRDRADQGDVGGGDDRLRDAQLVEDHEDGDGHDQRRGGAARHPAGGGVAHGAVHEATDGGGDRRGHQEDQHGGEDVRQVREHQVHEPGDGGDVQRPDRGDDDEDEQHPLHDKADELGRAAVGGEATDVLAAATVGQPLVEADAPQQLRDPGPEEPRDDVADEQDEQRTDDVRYVVQEGGEGILQALQNVESTASGRCGWHAVLRSRRSVVESRGPRSASAITAPSPVRRVRPGGAKASHRPVRGPGTYRIPAAASDSPVLVGACRRWTTPRTSGRRNGGPRRN